MPKLIDDTRWDFPTRSTRRKVGPSERIAEVALCAECLEPIEYKRTADDCLRWCENCQLLEGGIVYEGEE